jgi:hypothetical protein
MQEAIAKKRRFSAINNKKSPGADAGALVYKKRLSVSDEG